MPELIWKQGRCTKALLALEEFRTHFGPELNTEELGSAPNSERSGAVSGNSSSIRLLQESSEHLSHNTLASQEDGAKV